MRKVYFIASTILASSLFLLSGCSKEIDAPEEVKEENADVIEPQEESLPGIPFEIIAGTSEDTKTTISEGNPVWSANDKLNVFYAPASTSTYSSNCEFTITSENLAEKKFTGTLPVSYDSEASYDWYALYPYNVKITTPATTSGSYAWLPIGSADSSTAQVQTGNSNMNHLANQYFPLYGKVSAVAGSTVPSMTMKQALAVVRVRVTNSTASDLIVTDVDFTAPEEIVGTFWINFSGANPSFKKSGDSFVSETASLSVTSGTAITTGNTGDFYLAIKPITVAKDDYVTVTVNGTSKKFTMPKDVIFSEGKIKTINFNYTDCVELPWESAAEGEGVGKATLGAVEGVSVSADADYSAGPWYIKFNSTGHNITVKTDSEIGSVSIDAKAYKAGSGSTKSELIVSSSLDGSVWTEVERFDVPEDGEDAIFTTTSDFNSSHRYVKIAFNKALNNAGIGRIYIAKPSTDPRIVAAPIEVTALGVTDALAPYSVLNFVGGDDVSVKGFTGCVTAATIEAGKIKYSVAPNYGTGSVSGTITLQSAEASDKVIDVTQTGDTFSQTGASGSPLVLTIPADETTASFTITSAVLGWNAAVSPVGGYNLTIQTGVSTFAATHSGSADEDPQTITVSSTVDAPAAGDPLVLGTIDVYRNGNTDDSQKITITIKKAVSGTPGTKDYTTTWTATSGGLGTKIGSGTITTTTTGTSATQSWNYTRTLKSGESYTGWTSSCIQLGKNGGVENLTLSTSNIPGTIKSVSVECSSYNNAHKVSITVGGNTYLASTATAKWTTVSASTGTGTSSGEIVISFTGGTRALYIKSITVVYNN